MQQILGKLYQLQRCGIKPGLERISALLERLGNPHHALGTVFHIAGTNGKGTVASVLASILKEAGETVGLYTSPHIRRFNERIRIDGKPISDAEIVELYDRVKTIAEECGATFFETTTAMAFLAFHERTTVTVLECGLGGRFDATNVVQSPIAIITSIDYDHQEWLGSTLEAIAGEKAGIIKSATNVIIGEVRDELRHIFCKRAADVHVRSITFLNDLRWQYQLRDHTVEGMYLDLMVGEHAFKNLFVPLHGDHQVRNLAIVIAALDRYWGGVITPKCWNAIELGIANVYRNSGLQARIAVVQRDPLLVLDVAHNPAGCRALVNVLSKPPFPTRWNIVFGVMRDKDYDAMIEALSTIAEQFYISAPKSERACDPQELTNRVRNRTSTAYTFPTIGDALKAALSEGKPTVCVGSFFVIEEALEFLDNTATHA